MSLHEDVNLEEFIMAKDELSGADIKAMCSEAGLIALRERRMKVQMSDLRQSKDKCLYRKKGNIPDGLYIWINILNQYILAIIFRNLFTYQLYRSVPDI